MCEGEENVTVRMSVSGSVSVSVSVIVSEKLSLCVRPGEESVCV